MQHNAISLPAQNVALSDVDGKKVSLLVLRWVGDWAIVCRPEHYNEIKLGDRKEPDFSINKRHLVFEPT